MGEIDIKILHKLNNLFAKAGVSTSYTTTCIAAWNGFIRYAFGIDTPSWIGRRKIAANRRNKRRWGKFIGHCRKYHEGDSSKWRIKI